MKPSPPQKARYRFSPLTHHDTGVYGIPTSGRTDLMSEDLGFNFGKMICPSG
jgi:hypothetical protein